MLLQKVNVAFLSMCLCFSAGHVGASAQSAQTLPSTIPLFPLEDIMLFPHVHRPLHIFEPRYREMLAEALEGDRIIGMAMLQPGHEEDYFGRPPIYSVGCAGVIADVEELPDGRYNVVLHGISKFRVKSEDQSRPYRLAEVEAIPETLSDDDREALRRHRPRLLEALSSLSPGSPPTPDQLPDEMLVNVLAQYHKMDPMKRLDLLELDGPLPRAEAIIALLRLEGTVATHTIFESKRKNGPFRIKGDEPDDGRRETADSGRSELQNQRRIEFLRTTGGTSLPAIPPAR